jgi:ubiquinone/menaquinone biosynthesis C-methylase UbiE
MVWFLDVSLAGLYSDVREGYYYQVLEKNKIQRFWHEKKFELARQRLIFGPFLDIGAGSGVFFSYCRKDREIMLNLDFSFKQLKYGKTMNPDASYVNASALNLPLAAASIGTVCLLETIEHFNRQEVGRVLAEAFRVLKPNGKLIISTPNYKSLWPFLELLISSIGPIDYTSQHLTHFDAQRLGEYLCAAGFFIKSQETFFIVSPFFAPFSRRVANLLYSLERRLLPLSGEIILVEALKRGNSF